MSVSFSGQQPNTFPVNVRAIIDNNFVNNVALPTATTAAVVANTNSIDLQVATPYPTTEVINVAIIIGASTGTANNKNVNAVLQVSSNNANWANSAIFATPLVQATDNNAQGFAIAQTNIKLDPGSVRYIRAQFTTEANGGTPSGNGTIQLLF
jgi:hypothetical protein